MRFLFLLTLLTACPGPDSKPAAVTQCAEGEILDGELCVPEACGVGSWGNLPVDGNTVYVDGAAGDGGDGSEGAPLTSIQAGVDLAGDRGGGLVAVAAGTYVEVIAMGDDHKDVTLAGRCKDLVTIDGSGGGKEDPAISIIGDRKTPEIGIEGVTVTGGRYTGVWVQQATVSVSASELRGNTVIGILMVNATGTLVDVGTFDTQPDGTGAWGRGINVQDGASLTATRCTVQGNRDLGAYAAGAGTVVALVDTEVLDTAPNADGTGGRGIGVEDGASLTARGCTVQWNTEVGIAAQGAGTVVDLLDTEVLDTSASPDGSLGRGINVQESASLRATACTVQGNTGNGVLAATAGTVVALVETEILDTAPSPDGTGGRGIVVQDGASLTATGCTVQGNADIGVVAARAGTVVDLIDVEIFDTAPSPDGTGGHGIVAQEGASLTATGCTVQGNAELGVFALDPGTVVALMDTEILDTAPNPDGTFGRGIHVGDGAFLTATSCTVQGNTENGVLATGAGTVAALVATDVLETLRGRGTGLALGVTAQEGAVLTLADSGISGTEGPGLYVVVGGQIDADSVTVTENAFAGALVVNATLTLTSSAITDTVPDAEWGGGFGVYASDYGGAAALTLLDSTIGPHDYAAVWLDGPGSYDIEGNTFSASEGFVQGSATLHGNAVFAENGVTAWDEDTATGLLLADSTFSDASEIAVLLHNASAMLTGNSWSGNGVDLRQQLCDGPDHVQGDVTGEDGEATSDDAVPLTTPDLAGIANALVCPATNILVSGLVFTSLYLPETETAE